MDGPQVVPKKTKEYAVQQADHEILPSLPCRMGLLGPSGSGKTILLQSLLTDLYAHRGRSVFSRIYIWSPSVLVDSAWEPVIKMCKEMGQDNDKEQFLFQSYNPSDLEKVISVQKEVVARCKQMKMKKCYQIVIVIDDFADRPDFTRQERLVWELFFRGRHAKISTIISTQKWKAISPAIRRQATALMIFRLRSQMELDAVVEEISALVDRKSVLAMYREATAEPFHFLYVRLEAKRPEDMFFKNFDTPLLRAS